MIEFIKGKFQTISPALIVVDTGVVGYRVHISVSTYSALEGTTEGTLLIHEIIKEDSYELFGFADERERTVFRQLISVSGVGANTARMMLSSLGPDEISTAILQADVPKIKAIKGIGLKTAQRIIVELKDKVGKEPAASEIFSPESNTIREEALSALLMLGFSKGNVQKILDKLLSENRDLSVEELIKLALKRL